MKIIMLAGKGISTRYIYNGLAPTVVIDSILLTDPISTIRMIKSRIKRLGFYTVLNQLIFQVLILKPLNALSKKIKKRRITTLGLMGAMLPENKIIRVGSVNSDLCIETINRLNPDLIIVNGTAIISSKVLGSTNSIFINTHVGITPQYRGVHGGYWALRNQDAKNFGVTIHQVDKGIDTGEIIYQDTTTVTKQDNFTTYPLYQYALAIPLLIKTIDDIKVGKLKSYKAENVTSKLYYHPTFTDYLYGLIKYNVK